MNDRSWSDVRKDALNKAGACPISSDDVKRTADQMARAAALRARQAPNAVRMGLPTSSSSSPWSDDLELTFDTEPVIGWRAWRAYPTLRTFSYPDDPIDPVLVSAVVTEEWPAGERLEGHCEHQHHFGDQVPGHNCACGIWALRTSDALRARRVVRPQLDQAGFAVVGKVALWGRVLEFERGWRGRYAYPVELYLLIGERHDLRFADEFAAELQERYGVVVKIGPESAYLTRTEQAAMQKAIADINKQMGVTMQQFADALMPALKVAANSMVEAQKQFDQTMLQINSLASLAYVRAEQRLRRTKAVLRTLVFSCVAIGFVDVFRLRNVTVGITEFVVAACAAIVLLLLRWRL